MKKSTVLFIISTIFVQIYAHSYVSEPATRGNQGQTQTGCVMPSCTGPCRLPAAQAQPGTNVQRGQSLTIYWPRNNHPGGFVRFAWAPTAQSDSMAVFDANVDQFRCFEAPAITCKPGDPASPNGNDGATATQRDCWSTIQVPGWLNDGKWTLQWGWFGGGYTLGDYYSCIDYNVAGGPQSARGNSVFYGGDFAHQSDNTKCKYFNNNQIHVCLQDSCTNTPRQLAGAPENIAIGQTAGTISGGVETGGNNQVNLTIPCNSDFQCKSGICQSNGYCYVDPSKSLDAGGIAAIVFAMFFIVVVALAVVFVIVNKSEWSNWKPFNRSHGGGYGFKGSINPTNS